LPKTPEISRKPRRAETMRYRRLFPEFAADRPKKMVMAIKR
jgi:hypothetical protein